MTVIQGPEFRNCSSYPCSPGPRIQNLNPVPPQPQTLTTSGMKSCRAPSSECTVRLSLLRTKTRSCSLSSNRRTFFMLSQPTPWPSSTLCTTSFRNCWFSLQGHTPQLCSPAPLLSCAPFHQIRYLPSQWAQFKGKSWPAQIPSAPPLQPSMLKEFSASSHVALPGRCWQALISSAQQRSHLPISAHG